MASELCEGNESKLENFLTDQWAGSFRCKEGYFLDSVRGEVPGTRRGCVLKRKGDFMGDPLCFGNKVHDEDMQCISSFDTSNKSSVRRISIRTRDVRVSCNYEDCDDDRSEYHMKE